MRALVDQEIGRFDLGGLRRAHSKGRREWMRGRGGGPEGQDEFGTVAIETGDAVFKSGSADVGIVEM